MFGDRRAVRCAIHGFIPLSYQEYRIQKREDSGWKCPKCDSLADYIEYYQESFDKGCVQCKKKFDPESINNIIWSERILGLFCDKFCHDIYMTKLEEEHNKIRKARKQNALDKNEGTPTTEERASSGN